MRALFTADQHLNKGDSRLVEQESLWREVLELSRSLKVDAVLHGGDLLDAGWVTSVETMLAAERPLVEHQQQGGAPVYMVAGNHDFRSEDGPSGLDVLAEAGLIELAREPRVWEIGDVDVCALPWAWVARLIAKTDGSLPRHEVFTVAADLVVQVARDLKAQTRPNSATIALGHWAVSQTSLPSGLDVGTLQGVIVPMEGLDALGFDALLFGHVHNAQHIERFGFTYAGSPMQLDFGQDGQECGAWLIDTAVDLTPMFAKLESRRFINVDLTDLLAGDPDVDGAFVKVRGTVTEDNYRRIAWAEIVRDLERGGAHKIKFEIEVERERRQRGAVLSEGLTAEQQLAVYLEAIGVNGSVGAAMLDAATGYLS